MAAQHLAAAQGALQHTDEEESRAVNAANLKALDKTWVSGSQEQHVGIANGALVGEISSGQAAAQFVKGHDRAAESGVVNSAARKSASSMTKSCDER